MVKSSIKGPEDLKGKTFASRLGSSGELFVQKIRDKYKLGPNDFKLINLEPTDMVSVLDRGDIDGFFWFSPFEERSQQISGNKVRLFMRGGEVDFTNEVTLTARGDLIAQNPEMVTRFLRALIKGSDYAMSHRDETVDIVAAALKLDKKASEVTKQMNFLWPSTSGSTTVTACRRNSWARRSSSKSRWTSTPASGPTASPRSIPNASRNPRRRGRRCMHIEPADGERDRR
jgi:ABC-type nitrate/sulfonate/bicarbonate transport system substrate-binding protein